MQPVSLNTCGAPTTDTRLDPRPGVGRHLETSLDDSLLGDQDVEVVVGSGVVDADERHAALRDSGTEQREEVSARRF